MNGQGEDERLIDIERRLAHFERVVDDLSEIVAAQADRLDRQDLLIRRLRGQMQDIETGGRSPQDDKPPPHY